MNITRSLRVALCIVFVAVFALSAAAQRRTIDQAYGIAAAKLSVSDGSLQAPLTPYARSKGYVSTNAAADQPYFILQSSKGKGFVIVSGDERMVPVLAYSREGIFPTDSLPDNLQVWLQLYESEYTRLDNIVGAEGSDGGPANPPTAVDSTDMVLPFMRSTWGQNDPYNRLCPEYKSGTHSATGCGATVMAQTMYYYQYPDCGHGYKSYTTKTRGFSLSWDFDAHPIQWSLMKDTYPTSGTSEEEGRAIAELFYGCGVSVNMDYDEESGSQHPALMKSLNQYYGYDSDMSLLKRERMNEVDWHTALQDELKHHRPIITAAWNKSGDGHFFIIHGYQKEDGVPAYYINWGWRGRYDGYFVMPRLDYDGVPAHTLSEDISAIIGLQPENGIQNHGGQFLLRDVTVTGNNYNIDLSQHNQITIEVNKILGTSLNPFRGDLRVYLVGENNQKTLLADLVNNEFSQNIEKNITYKVTLPSTLESGTYAFRCYGRSYATGEEAPVPTQIPTTLTVHNEAGDYRASLSASNIQLMQTDNREFTFEATNVMNTADIPFSGTMQMLVTDYVTDLPITTFGSTKTLTDLGKYGYYPRIDTYSGVLPDQISDGAYRLHLGAQQSGYTNWGKVTKYTIEDEFITELGIDGSTPFWVLNGRATLTAPLFTMVFKLDGVPVADSTFIMGSPIILPPVPSKEGYTFSGWGVVPEVMPANDLTIEGSYIINKYRVRFVADGTMVSETVQDYGTPITLPTAPPKEGCTFQGWGEVPATVPAQDSEFTAIYSPNEYQLTFMVEDTVFTAVDVAYGSEITLPESPIKEGYSFVRWTNMPTTMPAGDLTVTAEFKVKSFFILFLLPDSTKMANMQQSYGTHIIFDREVSKRGHTFTGWMDQDGNYLGSNTTVPAHDLIYMAQFSVNHYAVTYTVDGIAYHTDSIAYGDSIVKIPEPVKEGHTFNGWSTAPDIMPAYDVTIKGTFKKNSYIILFLMPDSTKVGNLQQAYATPIVFNRDAAKTGHTFTGWLDQDGQPLDSTSTVPAHDVIYTAQFTVNQYQITFLIDGQPRKTFIVDYGTDLTDFFAEDGDYYYAWKSLPATMPARDLEVKGTITAVAGVEGRGDADSGSWYSLSGTKLSGKPNSKGVYIHNGRKVVIR